VTGALLLAALSLLAAAPAGAAGSCVTVSGTTAYTCSGSFDSFSVNDDLPSTTTEVTFDDLTSDLAFVNWVVPTSVTSSVVLEVETGSYQVGIAGPNDNGVHLSWTGSTGGDGDGECCEDGKSGHDGGSPAAMSLSFSGTFYAGTESTDTAVISAISTGGAGGKGGESDCCDSGDGGAGGAGGSVNVNGTGTITTATAGTAGLVAESSGGAGGEGAEATVASGGKGGDGGAGGLVILNSNNGITVDATGTGAAAVIAASAGGAGGDAKESDFGSSGGAGGAAGNVELNDSAGGSWTVTTTGGDSPGFVVTSIGADGGKGGQGDSGNGGDGGAGGAGGDISLISDVKHAISTDGASSPAFYVASIGGNGGNGGQGETAGKGGSGAAAGNAGDLSIQGSWTITTTGTDSAGIAAYSLGGAGGQGADGGWFNGTAGGGGPSGAGGAVSVTTDSGSTITTGGTGSPGILASSTGGYGGSGGGNTAFNVVAFNASGGSAGAGGEVTVDNQARITTTAAQSDAILAQSIGGGGGNGGSNFQAFYSESSSGDVSQGGAGGDVAVTNSAALITSGSDSSGIYAQSIGGAGGNGASSSGLTFGFGGGGSSGSAGGDVTVTNTGDIITGEGFSPGDSSIGEGLVCVVGCSHGIFAQSVGGGGGNGGSTSGWFAIGAPAGGGGDGGEVIVSNSGADISTSLPESSGIFAESVGGGGGRGSTTSTSGTNSFAIGASGGDAGDGGAVSVSSIDGSTIATRTYDSPGIQAESVGGGGGNGSFTYEIGYNTKWTYPPDSNLVGGSGGDGGNGGSVTVSTLDSSYSGSASNQIATEGDLSAGILAQSIGGGGGRASALIALDLELYPDNGTTMTVGATGGSGGSGGDVTIESDAIVSTAGRRSPGLEAQSIGGGGGIGDVILLSNFAATDDALDTAPLKVGGTAGSNGNAGTVEIESTGAITTAGAVSPGIIAQSIGGGGGHADLHVLGSVIGDWSYDTVSIGGSTGGTGGTVSVTAAGSIGTADRDSDGILAQSVGGGGGVAGLAFEHLDISATSGSLGFAIGGSAGTADGGAVNVSSTGDVTVAGDGSRGILAQSVGGGGGIGHLLGFGDVTAASSGGIVLALGGTGASGDGGAVTLSNAGTVVTQASGPLSGGAYGLVGQSVGGGGGLATLAGDLLLDGNGEDVKVSLGGSAGSGDGGTVALTNTGTVATSDHDSHGVLAQSVGGGGGIVTSFAAIHVTPAPGESIRLGGDGATGDGGTVTVQNAGSVMTTGNASKALMAQSIGGGGGLVGEGSRLADLAAADQLAVTLVLGGSNGSDGDGGAVTVNSTGGALVTRGTGSAAILAQSIGGGGGQVGADGAGLAGTIDMSGQDVTGNGGQVSVDVSGGSIDTGPLLDPGGQVVGSYGIFAQSVGGGGGIAGTVLLANTGSNFGSDLSMYRDGTTATGTGGDVSVTLGSGTSLVTRGNSAAGIFAQSVGGGGGVEGKLGGTISAALVGSNGGAGAAGAVNVTVDGDIATFGDFAHGVFAQSAGGKTGSSYTGGVTVDVGGSIVASGAGADGIYAQSSGVSADIVTITLESGARVLGGRTATSSDDQDGFGVDVVDGGYNELTIERRASLSALSGVAINYSGDGTLSIDNSGVVAGSVYDKNESGALGIFINEQTGTFYEGPVVDAVVDNSGTIEIGTIEAAADIKATGAVTQSSVPQPAGPAAATGSLMQSSNASWIAHSEVSGDLTQSSTGRMVFDVDFEGARADTLTIDGTADLGGTLQVRPQTLLPDRTVPIITLAGPVAADDLATNGQLVHYSLPVSGNVISVVADSADFTPAGQKLDSREKDIAEHLQAIWDAGGDGFGRLFAALENGVTAGRALSDQLDLLAPGVAVAQSTRLHSELQDFADGLLSCPELAEGTALITEGQCGWARVIGRSTSQGSTDGVDGFDIASVTYAAGGQVEIAPGWYLGGSAAFQTSWLSGQDGNIEGDGLAGYLGVVLKHQIGPLILSGALSGSVGSQEVKREVSLAGLSDRIKGSPDSQSAGLRLSAAYELIAGAWYVRPKVGLDVIYARTGAYDEKDQNGLGLSYEAADQWVVIGTPAVEVGRRIDIDDGVTLRAFATAGVSFLSQDSWTAKARFRNAPSSAGTFDQTVPYDNIVGRLDVGAQLLTKDGTDVRLQYQGAWSGNAISNAGLLTVGMHF
jgi:uncharacterized protein YhjY with autotransporter beta-barrel domain